MRFVVDLRCCWILLETLAALFCICFELEFGFFVCFGLLVCNLWVLLIGLTFGAVTLDLLFC